MVARLTEIPEEILVALKAYADAMWWDGAFRAVSSERTTTAHQELLRVLRRQRAADKRESFLAGCEWSYYLEHGRYAHSVADAAEAVRRHPDPDGTIMATDTASVASEPFVVPPLLKPPYTPDAGGAA